MTSHVTGISTCNSPAVRIHSVAVQLQAAICKAVHGQGNQYKRRYHERDRRREAFVCLAW